MIYSNPWDFNPRGASGHGGRVAVVRGGYGLYGFATNLRTFTGNMRRNAPTYQVRAFYVNDAAFSPGGLRNCGLRPAPRIIAGVNSADVLKAPTTARRCAARSRSRSSTRISPPCARTNGT